MKKSAYTKFLFNFIFLLGCLFAMNLGAQNLDDYPKDHEVQLVKERKRQLLLLPPGENNVLIYDLVVGEQYLLAFNEEDLTNSCQPSFQLTNGSQDTSFSEVRIDFIAKSKKVYLKINTNCVPDYNTRLALYISVARRGNFVDIKKATTPKAEGPVSAFSGTSATSLIKDIFIGGGCFDVSNVSAIGGSTQIGEFSGGASSIQIEAGVIIASGNVSNANGPNSGGGTGNSAGGSSDPDLFAIGKGSTIFDAGGIQFDFKPTIPLVQFNYVFGSDEYEEYSCSSFNDVFGFFINGAGIGFNKNIALIPGTTIPVKINTVNQGTPGGNGNIANCSPPLGSLAYSGFFVSNPLGSPDVEYDGFTTVFTAEQAVIPCSTYHIKLAVGDAGDAIFDSGVFLEANSFNAGGNANGEVIVPSSGSNVVYEGCTDGFIKFFRANSIGLDVDLVITFTIEPSSTATPGVDYAPFGTSITIPAGEEFVEIPIYVFNDLLTEGTETIKIKLSTPCSCETPFIEILIKDPIPIVAVANDVTICESDGGADISVSATGGIGMYTYLWNNGATDPSIYVATATTTTYTVTVTDECGKTATEDVVVTVVKNPHAKISGYGKLCFQQPGKVNLTVEFEGPGPWTLVYSINGVAQPPITGITNTPYTLVATKPGTYVITQIYGLFDCPGDGEGEGLVDEVKVDLYIDVQQPPCAGIPNGEINIDPFGGEEEYYIQWSNGVEGFNYIDLLSPGTYKVSVTDANGCKIVKSFVIAYPPEIMITAQIQNVKDCLNPNGGAIDQTVTGGLSPYKYVWDKGLPPTEDQSSLIPGIYTVTVTDNNNCSQVINYLITANDAPIASATTLKNVTCQDLNSGQIGLNVSGGTPPYSYNWSDNSNNKDLNGVSYGDWFVTITDAGGCKTFAQASISADTLKPIVLTGQDQILSCSVTQITLDASATPIQNGFLINWSTTGGSIVSGGNTLTPIVNAPGTYVLTITNSANGCKNTGDIIVDPDVNTPSVFVNPPSILNCNVTTITLDGSASSQGGQYQVDWTTQGGNIISNPTGSYTVDINAPGKYILKVVNSTNGCDATYSIDVLQDIVKPLAQAGNPVTLTCKDTQLGLNGNGSSTGANINYDWSTSGGFIVTGKTTLSPLINKPGTYYIEVLDNSNGCLSVDSVVVNEDVVKPLAAGASPEILTCAKVLVPISATGSSSGSNYTYSWSTVNGIIQGSNTGFTVNASSIGSYSVVVTNNINGCTEIASVNVNEDKNKPVANAGTDLELTCQQTTQVLSGVGSSVGPEFTYKWVTSNGNIVSGSTTLNPTINQAGIYTLIVTSSINGCTSSDDVEITLSADFPVAVVTNPEQLTCVKLSVLINGVGSSAGPDFSYLWTTTNGNIVSGSTSSTPEVNKAGVYVFTITNSINGCVTSKNVTVVEDKVSPKANAGGDFEAGCFDKPVDLDGSGSNGKGALTFNWTTSNGEIVAGATTVNPSIIKPGLYTLLITDNSNGCTSEDNIEVTSNALADATFALKIPGCFGEFGSAQVNNVIGGVPPYQYSIDGGNTYSGNAVFNKLDPGVYTVLIKDGYDCVIARKFEIPAKTELKVLVEPKVELFLGETYILKAQVNIPKNLIAKVEWFSSEGLSRPDSLVTKVDILQTTEYTVRVTDISGCTASARVLVVIADPEIYVPNAFSPYDLNGQNDVIMVFARSSGIKKINSFEIFNRWGEKMFEANNFQPNDPNFGWNGLHKGKAMDPSVFVWWLEVEYINGKKKIYKGDVTLMR